MLPALSRWLSFELRRGCFRLRVSVFCIWLIIERQTFITANCYVNVRNQNFHPGFAERTLIFMQFRWINSYCNNAILRPLSKSVLRMSIRWRHLSYLLADQILSDFIDKYMYRLLLDRIPHSTFELIDFRCCASEQTGISCGQKTELLIICCLTHKLVRNK